MELLDCVLLGVCAVIRSNTVLANDKFVIFCFSFFPEKIGLYILYESSRYRSHEISSSIFTTTTKKKKTKTTQNLQMLSAKNIS